MKTVKIQIINLNGDKQVLTVTLGDMLDLMKKKDINPFITAVKRNLLLTDDVPVFDIEKYCEEIFKKISEEEKSKMYEIFSEIGHAVPPELVPHEYVGMLVEDMGKNKRKSPRKASDFLKCLLEKLTEVKEIVLSTIHKHLAYLKNEVILDLGDLCRDLIKQLTPKQKKELCCVAQSFKHYIPIKEMCG